MRLDLGLNVKRFRNWICRLITDLFKMLKISIQGFLISNFKLGPCVFTQFESSRTHFSNEIFKNSFASITGVNFTNTIELRVVFQGCCGVTTTSWEEGSV